MSAFMRSVRAIRNVSRGWPGSIHFAACRACVILQHAVRDLGFVAKEADSEMVEAFRTVHQSGHQPEPEGFGRQDHR